MKREEEIENVKKKLLDAVGKYSDYRRYSLILSDLDEEYDETLELYNYGIWLGQSDGSIREKASHMLSVTLRLFEDMENNAQIELYSVLEEIMGFDKEEQKKIWSRNIFLSRNTVSKERLEAMILDWDEQPYNQEEALESFEQLLAQKL